MPTNEQLLGELIAEVKSMGKRLDREFANARETRSKMFRKIDDQDRRHHETEEAVRNLERQMEEVIPIAAKMTKWQYIGLGVVLTVGAIGSALGATLTLFKDRIGILFRGLGG